MLNRKTYGAPDWYMPTYNIVTQLSEFVGDYLTVNTLCSIINHNELTLYNIDRR